jgi:hypothetical protein|tara:strand:- start:6 stop:260 length:255 start_codon:yes stop_codon:yes gene_type:complete
MINTSLIAVRNPKWHTRKDIDGNVLNDADGNPLRIIDCECQWSHLGDNTQEWLPFSADSHDSEQHGKDLYAALVNGDHGAIADE